MVDSACIFCRIAARDIPADIVRESDHVVAFRDTNPQAPTHILIIPKEHVESVAELGDEHGGTLTDIMQAATQLARAEGIAESGWRLVTNVGPERRPDGLPPPFPSARWAPDGVAPRLSGARMGAAAGEGGRRRQEGTGPPPRENSHVAGATTQVKILVPGDQSMVALLGQRDVFLKIIESAFDCRILVRGNEITVSGRQEEAEQVARIFEELLALLEKGHDLTDSSVDQTIALVKGDDAQPGDADIRPSEVLGDRLLTARGKGIAPRTMGQKRFVDAIRSNTVTFVIGPAGTGKTYLAVATAVKALQEHQVSRLILTRPAVEAGERLGYLPGTLYEKIDPYMRPLYDALFEMTGAETLPRLMERGTVEVAPLAFMRGRTLNDAFIILDEAQNTTPEQMKMFLTRIGFGSKAVINGDSTQTDLASGQTSGLSVIQEILDDIDGIAFCHLGGRDVVRHKIVQDIVEAYDRFGQQRLEVQP